MNAQTYSSMRSQSIVEKGRYWYDLFKMYRGSPFGAYGLDDVGRDVHQYQDLLRRHGGQTLEGCRTLELGFGQRPFRLFWLSAMGCEAYGIDLDVPVLKLRLSALAEVYRRNGLERLAKTFARVALFDGRVWREFARRMRAETGKDFHLPVNQLFQGDIADPDVWDRIGGTFDFMYSEDVFEHIPAGSLPAVVDLMHGRLASDGICIIAPLIYTGISGGHHLEWYPEKVEQDLPRKTSPWEHLRGDRYPADSYLNKLSYADYRELFASRFEILEEVTVWPRLGEKYLTPDIQAELSEYDREELFSNKVRFVLKRK